MEKSLLDKLMHGLDHDFTSLHADLKDDEEREESAEPEHKPKEEVHLEKDAAKMEEKNTALELHEAERTKKKRKKLKESDIMKTDIL